MQGGREGYIDRPLWPNLPCRENRSLQAVVPHIGSMVPQLAKEIRQPPLGCPLRHALAQLESLRVGWFEREMGPGARFAVVKVRSGRPCASTTCRGTRGSSRQTLRHWLRDGLRPGVHAEFHAKTRQAASPVLDFQTSVHYSPSMSLSTSFHRRHGLRISVVFL